MATSAELYNQMQGIQSQLAGMAPADQTGIERDLMAKVGNFQNQYNELAGLQATAYSAPSRLMEQYNQQYGTVGGAGALNRLSSILGNIGQQYGTANALSNVIQTKKGTISDLAQGAMQQYQSQQDALKNQYQMLTTPYQAMLQQEEAARQRAFEAEQAQKAQDFQAAQAAASRAASRASSSGRATSVSAFPSYGTNSGYKVVRTPTQQQQLTPQAQTSLTAMNAADKVRGLLSKLGR